MDSRPGALSRERHESKSSKLHKFGKHVNPCDYKEKANRRV